MTYWLNKEYDIFSSVNAKGRRKTREKTKKEDRNNDGYHPMITILYHYPSIRYDDHCDGMSLSQSDYTYSIGNFTSNKKQNQKTHQMWEKVLRPTRSLEFNIGVNHFGWVINLFASSSHVNLPYWYLKVHLSFFTRQMNNVT